MGKNRMWVTIESTILGRGDASKEIGHGSKIFLVMHSLFALGIGISNLFVNVYFWKINAGLHRIALYNLFHYLTLPLAFTFAGWISKERDRLYSLRLGIMFHIIYFALILLLEERTKQFLVPLGILLGIGAGFFYLAINVLIYDLTDNTSVERFNGLNGFMVGVSNMLAPLAGGLLSGLLPDLVGYKLIFALSITLFCLVIFLSTKLNTRPLPHSFQLGNTWRDREYWRVLFSSLFMGLRTGSFPFLIALLVFAARNEVLLGTFGMATAGITLGSSFLGGRLINKNNRRWWALGAALILFIAIVPLGLSLSFVALAIFGILDSAGNPLFGITFQAKTFKIIDRHNKGENRTEYLVARELALNLGRISSIALFLIFLPGGKTTPEAIIQYMRLLAPISIFMWLSIRDPIEKTP